MKCLRTKIGAIFPASKLFSFRTIFGAYGIEDFFDEFFDDFISTKFLKNFFTIFFS